MDTYLQIFIECIFFCVAFIFYGCISDYDGYFGWPLKCAIMMWSDISSDEYSSLNSQELKSSRRPSCPIAVAESIRSAMLCRSPFHNMYWHVHVFANGVVEWLSGRRCFRRSRRWVDVTFWVVWEYVRCTWILWRPSGELWRLLFWF